MKRTILGSRTKFAQVPLLVDHKPKVSKESGNGDAVAVLRGRVGFLDLVVHRSEELGSRKVGRLVEDALQNAGRSAKKFGASGASRVHFVRVQK